MKKIISFLLTTSIIIILVLATSCKDNREIWIQEYKNTKCSLSEIESDFKKDSVVNSAKYIDTLAKIQAEIQKIEKPINSKINQLDFKIGQVNIKYLDESRRISEEQELSNGHKSTPQYENRLDQNDRNNSHEIFALENKKALLLLQLDENKILQRLYLKQNKIQKAIASTTRHLKEKYKTTCDSLKNKLDNQNSDLKMILKDLDSAEKEKFKNQR